MESLQDTKSAVKRMTESILKHLPGSERAVSDPDLLRLMKEFNSKLRGADHSDAKQDVKDLLHNLVHSVVDSS